MSIPNLPLYATMLAFSTTSAIAFVACASDSAADFGAPDSGGLGADPGGGECTSRNEGAQRACTCLGGQAGTQTCRSGAYEACTCGATQGKRLCKAGFYSGEFTGKYKPGAFGLGIIESPLEVEIHGQGANGYPALSFTLNQTQEGSNEFPTYRIRNGCMIGSATAYGTNNPFVARIEGELDCATGVMSATITGQYDLLGLNLKFQFAGTLSGQFTLPASQISNGVWSVKEPNALLGQPAGGGGGTWSALWADNNPPPGEDPCSSMWSDAGADAATGDAGTDAGAD